MVHFILLKIGNWFCLGHSQGPAILWHSWCSI